MSVENSDKYSGVLIKEREEKIVLEVDIDKKLAKKFEKQISVISPSFNINDITEDGIVNLKYNMTASYYNEVVEVLQAFAEIASHPKSIKKVDIKELNFNEILIEKCLNSLRSVKKSITKSKKN